MITRMVFARAARWCGLLGGLGIIVSTIAAEPPVAVGRAAPGDLTNVLGGPDRYLTAASTDKPLYKPGETVHVRGVLLHHATKKPLAANPPRAVVEIRGPKGDTVASGMVQAEQSVMGFQWAIPAEQPGGQYTLTIRYPWDGHAPAERMFEVRAYRAPRLKSQIKFVRDGYGPGDEVAAGLSVARAEGGVPVGAKVTAVARVDGDEVFRGPAEIDALGKCRVTFRLPAEMRRGEGTLALMIDDSGIVETAAKTIPIVLQTVDLAIYPEGGDLVAGVENRVYFEALTPAGKPADLAGDVIDAAGTAVATFRSEHEGRGRFSFTPEAGEAYRLRIAEPAGIKTTYDLPKVKASGVVLGSTSDVVPASGKVALRMASPEAGTFTVHLRHRDLLLSVQQVKLAAGAPEEIALDAGTAGGVLTATVFNGAGEPVAERLLFRDPAGKVTVTITPDASRYVPGGKAALTIETRDSSGRPVASVVGVTVTDDSVLELIDKREQAPRLPVMVFLEPEVRELADAHVYLDPDNADAPRAVDLLLGTQGWRRFATVDLQQFLAKGGDPGRRALAARLAIPPAVPTASDAMELGLAKDGRAELREAAAAPAPVNALAAVPVDKPMARPEPELAAAPPVAERAKALKEQAFAEEVVEAGEKKLARDAFLDHDDRQAVGGRGRAFGKIMAARNDFVSVRVYAHTVRPDRQPGERRDFAETLFWSAGITTDASGIATVEFGLNDSVTSFRVAADAFTSEGSIGAGTTTIESVEPFYVEPKLPLHVTVGDRIDLPLGLVNATATRMDDVALSIRTPKGVSIADDRDPVAIPADGRIRRILPLEVRSAEGGEVSIAASAAGYSDTVIRTLTVHPRGFPVERTFGGLLEPDGTVTETVLIPQDVVAGSVSSRVRVYPTPLASMTAAMERLIQEPCGCFEQTSSTTYPLVMAQRYFKSHAGIDPAIIARSEEVLARGYDRLVGFESRSKGFEWFGADPGHDALSAYGLMQFTEMSQVRPVDAAMLDRTRAWLLAQRDGSGGYARKTHTLHTWVTDADCAAAYDTWALLASGVRDGLDKEIAFAIDGGEKSKNSYAAALAANVAVLARDEAAARRLLDRLVSAQMEDGSVGGATMSIVGSGGEALAIETTSLAVLAWLADARYAEPVERAIRYLAECCKGGRFGSTQSTVLAVKAIVAYDESRARPKAGGTIELVVDGRRVGDPVAFDIDTQGAIDLPAIDERMTPGEHTVELRMKGGSTMPCSVAVAFSRVTPESSDDCRVRLEAKLRDTTLAEGSATEADVMVTNRTEATVPNPIAIIGIPGGLEVRHEQLAEHVTSGKLAAYEIIGRDLVLYWRSLGAEERVELPVSLIAAIPGSYTGPASRAYLYYSDEHKQWADGFSVTITARDPQEAAVPPVRQP
jgi:alpha-2-macroglobulin-like protein